ncbi:MAG: hypothetical protein GY739_01860 [Mesoflavibacter sp.]|nr:hypothetical protein [Mesoflavibacter sp.]
MIEELIKFWYRLFNKKKYHILRNKMRDDKKKKLLTPEVIKLISDVNNSIQNKTEINFSHSGHLGDLIYALPLIQELSKTKKCNLYVKVNQSYNGHYFKHPSGNIKISSRSYDMLLPLLRQQNFLNKIEKFSDQKIDVDLDSFRALPISKQFHSIRWYFHLTGIQADMTLPYLDVKPHEIIKNKIIIVRTFRSRNMYVDYSFLKKYDNLLFIGTKEEYIDIKKSIPNLEYYDVKDFLEMAQIIKACKFYISNQTFSYALAEGLKVPRLLEAYPNFPVVFPIAGSGSDFYFQTHFEKLVENYNLNY